jgi:acetylornithine deacetylase/succinyl-diaminopimelate desuccinylase-like protein
VSSSRPPVARRSALTVAALALAALAAAVLTIAGAHIRPSGQGHVPSGGPGDGTGPTRFIQQPSASAPPKRIKPSTATDLAGLFLYVLGVVGVVLGLVVLIAVLRSMIYRRRLARVRHRAPPHAGEDAAPDLTRTLRAAVDEALDELGSGGPVSDAIIACWLRLQAASSDAGIEPVASDTAEEAIERVFTVRTVRPAPLRALAELYREARFSGHQMVAADADAARAALREVLADLSGASSQTHATG